MNCISCQDPLLSPTVTEFRTVFSWDQFRIDISKILLLDTDDLKELDLNLTNTCEYHYIVDTFLCHDIVDIAL